MILLRFGLVIVWIHFWETRKVIIFMASGPGGRDHDSQNQLFLVLDAPRYFESSKTNIIIFKVSYFWNFENLNIRTFCKQMECGMLDL